MAASGLRRCHTTPSLEWRLAVASYACLWKAGRAGHVGFAVRRFRHAALVNAIRCRRVCRWPGLHLHRVPQRAQARHRAAVQPSASRRRAVADRQRWCATPGAHHGGCDDCGAVPVSVLIGHCVVNCVHGGMSPCGRTTHGTIMLLGSSSSKGEHNADRAFDDRRRRRDRQ